MPVTGPIHTNPFVDGLSSSDAHASPSTSSSKPPAPTLSSSRPLASTGVLGRLSSHSARAQGARVSTNPFDTPRVSTNPFDTPRVSTNPFDTPRVSTNPFDTPRVSTNPFGTPRVSTNPFGTPRVGGHEPASTMRLGTNEADHPAGDPLANDEPVAAAAEQRDGSDRPLVEPEPGVRLSPLKIPPRASLDEEWGSPVSVLAPETPPVSPSLAGSPHASPSLGPRADTASAFAKLRNRHGVASPRVAPDTPHTPHTPGIDAGQRHEEAAPDLEAGQAPHEQGATAARPAKRPQNMPNAAAEFAEETMESTGQFMTPMIEAQMFAAESQMFISMVQAQVDVAKAAASAVSDAARKS